MKLPEAKLRETELIKSYGRINNGTGCLANKSKGGEHPLSKAQRIVILSSYTDIKDSICVWSGV